MALVKRAKTNDALWGAGLVPQSTRDSAQERSAPVVGGVDEGHLRLGRLRVGRRRRSINVDTGAEADAKDLSAKATAQLADVQEEPAVHDDGPGPVPRRHQDRQQGRHVPRHASTYNQQQVDDLINRVKGLLKSFGGAMGGGGAMPPCRRAQ